MSPLHLLGRALFMASSTALACSRQKKKSHEKPQHVNPCMSDLAIFYQRWWSATLDRTNVLFEMASAAWQPCSPWGSLAARSAVRGIGIDEKVGDRHHGSVMVLIRQYGARFPFKDILSSGSHITVRCYATQKRQMRAILEAA
ncbi:hypothetical protein B0T13DRAFT_450231 [Neurospora crassa]|nr:hypothetical protein B0T13DRAFT_450231 [Neurospora crassa]